MGEARLLLHGRPFNVMPLHVVAGFFESHLGSKDSGVRLGRGMRFIDFDFDLFFWDGRKEQIVQRDKLIQRNKENNGCCYA